MARPRLRVRPIRRGEVIRASFLNDLVDGVNFQREAIPQANVQSRELELKDASGEETQPTANTFNEVSRTTSTVRVENPADSEQYVDVLRIESVTFQNLDGVTLTFVFDNGSS